MTAIRRMALLCSLAVALLGFGVRAHATDAEVAAVHAADNDWLKAYNSGDLATVNSLYDEHAVVYPPGVAPLHGAAAIKAFFVKDNAEFLKGGMVFALDPKPDGGVSGDWGWSSGTFTVKDKAGKVVDKGWYFSVSRKVNGKWLYVRDAWNSNGPAAPAAPAPAAAAPKK